MTTNESFKRRIRARMTETGERYGAARRVLIERAARRDADGAARESDRGDGRRWVSDPDVADEALREATGRGWDEWCDLLDAWPGRDDGHTAIATYVRDDLGVDGWWAQTVTVGYERITGRRLPYQRPDGTFSISKSRTVAVDAAALRELVLDEGGRDALLPGVETELRSRPTTRDVRLAIGGGTALFVVEDRGDGRAKVTVSHERLATADDVELWRDYWTDWLDTLDGSR